MRDVFQQKVVFFAPFFRLIIVSLERLMTISFKRLLFTCSLPVQHDEVEVYETRCATRTIKALTRHDYAFSASIFWDGPVSNTHNVIVLHVTVSVPAAQRKTVTCDNLNF